MMFLTLIMTALLGYQVMMPAVDNGKYMFFVDKEGTIIRMNTQDGKMEKCGQDLQCNAVSNNK